MTALKAMEPGTRKLAGRPFKDADRQAAVLAARGSGGSVAEAMGLEIIAPARKPKKDMAAALKKPRVRKPKA